MKSIRPLSLAVANPLLHTALLQLGGTSITEALQLSNDPQSYFGGPENDNQPYVDWANSISSRYSSSVYMPSIDPSNGAAIHWSIVDDEWLHVAVAARATSWIGFGLSGAGGMLGSDMALFVSNSPSSKIVDAHVIEAFLPQTDDCQQDWTLVENDEGTVDVATKQASLDMEQSGFLAFEARRRLDTGDPQDLQIINDADPAIPPHRIIAAWGDSPDVRYHGTNVARGAIRFYGSKDPQVAFEEAMNANAEGSFLIQATNYSIPPEDTTYADFCLSRSDLLKQGVPDSNDLLNVIGFRPVLSPGSEPYVHHFLVYGSYDGSDNSCEEGDFDHLTFAWAPGDDAFALPDFLGAPLFGPEGFQSFYIEVHYDNPRIDRGIVDSSGVQMFYTSKSREFPVGVLQVGDPDVGLFGAPVSPAGSPSLHTFDCPGSCSSLFLKNEPVTVIREHLHMHQQGVRATNEQIRNGEVIRTASVEVWEFDQNGNAPVLQEPYQVLPGDSFRTNCYYRASDKAVFGLSSREEMCIAFLFYYPLKSVDFAGYSIPWICGYGYDDDFPVCSEHHTQTSLEQDSTLNRDFGRPTCMAQDGPTKEKMQEPAGPTDTSAAAKISSITVLSLLVVAATVLYMG